MLTLQIIEPIDILRIVEEVFQTMIIGCLLVMSSSQKFDQKTFHSLFFCLNSMLYWSNKEFKPFAKDH